MTPHVLRETLDMPSAETLRVQILRFIDAGADVHLDGSHVAQVGVAALQVLQSARRTARSFGLGFEIKSPSEALLAMTRMACLDSLLDPLIAKGSS